MKKDQQIIENFLGKDLICLGHHSTLVEAFAPTDEFTEEHVNEGKLFDLLTKDFNASKAFVYNCINPFSEYGWQLPYESPAGMIIYISDNYPVLYISRADLDKFRIKQLI